MSTYLDEQHDKNGTTEKGIDGMEMNQPNFAIH